MKKRKVMAVLLILIAVAVLGIGYASITKNLSLSGSASATPNPNSFQVKFTSSRILTGDATILTDITYTDLVANFAATLDTDHPIAEAEYTITNASTELKAGITKGTESITGDTGYFTTTITFTDIPTSTPLAPAGTTTLKVKVELTKTPVDNKSISITIPFTATAVEA